MKRLLAVALIATFFASCGSREVVYDNKCGALKEFVVDDAYCNKYGLRNENFSLQYPTDLAVETQEDFRSDNYVSFFKYDADSAIIESVNIGFYYGLSESGGDNLFGGLLGMTKENLLGSMMGQFEAQGFKLQDITLRDETVRGETHFTARAKFKTSEDMYGFNGSYLIQLVMIATESDHGVLMIMAARDDSGIKSFEDFESKGCISPILQSLD